jgi:hypothetical protein
MIEKDHELSPADASAALSAFLTARVARQRFTVTAINPRLVGGTVVVDVTFSNQETVTLRIARGKAAWLRDALVKVLAG